MAGKKIDWPEYGRHAFLLAYIVAVVAGIVCFRLFAPSLPLLIVWWILLGIHFFYTAAVLAEGLAAVIYDFLPRAPIPHVLTSEKKRKYRITVLIAAYLPNEQDLILETVAHWLTRINFGTVPYRVVLSYNTPKPLPVEQQLAALAAVEPRLTVISTPDSKSKARNVNYALTQIPPINPDEFEIVSVMDADHLPREDVYEYVLSNFESRPELDIVQGRCVIRNVRDTWVTRVISVEFDMIYNL
jgi:cellulose synthase/poly-beta-1,6-N-acetylglucosamine synthase-like glycosyltransferase